MTKKQKILVGVLVALAAIFLFSKFSDGETFETKLESGFGTDAESHQDTKERPVYTPEEEEYNLARQQYWSLSKHYPPESWALSQIQEAINNWDTIKNCLVNYQNYMAKMGLESLGKKNAMACNDLSTAQQLEAQAKSTYEMYLKKKTVFDELVVLCKKYSITVSDLGIKGINEDSYSTLNKALTKAKSLGELREKYNQLEKLCNACGLKTKDLLGTTKWYDVNMVKYNSVLTVARRAYDEWLTERAKVLLNNALRDLMPIANVPASADPTTIAWFRSNHNGEVDFATRPQAAKYSLNTTVWTDIANQCKKYEGLGQRFNELFRSMGNNFDYPAYMCQRKHDWPYVNSIQQIIENDRRSGGGDHLATRKNHNILFKYYDEGIAPFRDSDIKV